MYPVHSFSNIQTKWLKGKYSKTLLMHCYRTKWGSLYLFGAAFTGDNRLYDHRQTGRFPGGRCGGCFHFQALHWLWPTKWIYMSILLNVKKHTSMVCQNSNPFGNLSFRFEFIFVCSKNIMTSLKLFFFGFFWTLTSDKIFCGIHVNSLLLVSNSAEQKRMKAALHPSITPCKTWERWPM